MSGRENKRKIDIEAILFMYVLHLKEEKNKKYSSHECEKNVVYLFDNYDEYKNYFEVNGFPEIRDSLLDICTMKVTKKGTIIALKGLCDYTIRKYNLNQTTATQEQQHFDVLAVPCGMPFVVAPEKAKEFQELKPNPELLKKIEEASKKLNIKVELEPTEIEGPVFKKTRKPSKK